MEQDNLAAEQLHLVVEQGCDELHPHLIIFITSFGAGETCEGRGIGINTLEVSSRARPSYEGWSTGG